MSIFIEEGELRFGVHLSSGAWHWLSGGSPFANQYVHVTGTYKKGQEFCLWVNGLLVDQKALPGGQTLF